MNLYNALDPSQVPFSLSSSVPAIPVSMACVAESSASPIEDVLEPDISTSSNECDVCNGREGGIDIQLSQFTFETFEKASQLQREDFNDLHFVIQTPLGERRFKLWFKVVTLSKIKRSKKSNRKGCLIFNMLPHTSCYVHLSPLQQAKNELIWLEKTNSVEFAENCKFTAIVFSRTGSETAIVGARAREGILVNTSLWRKEWERVRTSSSIQSVPIPIAKRRREKEEKKSIELEADLAWDDLPLCPIGCTTDFLQHVAGFGVPIGSYSFESNDHQVGKNLRQKASAFEISIYSVLDGVKQLEELKCIKFKVYAGSTLKRGKKDLRRSCVLFPIDSHRVAHVMGLSSSELKKSIKWTEEKKEKFIAFEGGCQFVLRILSLRQFEECEVRLRQNGVAITKWKDLRNPSKTAELQLDSIGPQLLPEWQMEPSTWNMSMNSGERFYITIISHGIQMPMRVPKVFVLAKDRRIEVKVEQYDERYRKSLVFLAPRLFSSQKIVEATRENVKFSRTVQVLVIDSMTERKLWSSSFTYEVGVPLL